MRCQKVFNLQFLFFVLCTNAASSLYVKVYCDNTNKEMETITVIIIALFVIFQRLLFPL